MLQDKGFVGSQFQFHTTPSFIFVKLLIILVLLTNIAKFLFGSRVPRNSVSGKKNGINWSGLIQVLMKAYQLNTFRFLFLPQTPTSQNSFLKDKMHILTIVKSHPWEDINPNDPQSPEQYTPQLMFVRKENLFNYFF